jgi:hypothetical protein
MPKISYLDILDNGADYTEVTASHIEQKIADIEALLRGMIDEDNMLCDNDGTEIVPLSPSNVVDMPVETRSVQQCMKFFGITGDHTTGIVENLFSETVDIFNINPSFIMLNGIGDKEIIMLAEGAEKGSVQRKSTTIEIPFNYSPLTWGDLWDYIYPINKNIKVSINPDRETWSDTLMLDEMKTLEDFLYEFNVSQTDYVIETSYNLSETNTFEYYVDILTLRNSVLVSAMVYPKDAEWLYRIATSILCRINP